MTQHAARIAHVAATIVPQQRIFDLPDVRVEGALQLAAAELEAHERVAQFAQELAGKTQFARRLAHYLAEAPGHRTHVGFRRAAYDLIRSIERCHVLAK